MSRKDQKPTEYATSRQGANKRRAMAREALRVSIDGEKCLTELDEINTEAKMCESSAVPALRLRADIQFKKLAKILPDVKAVEITDERDKTVDEMTDEELAAQLAEVTRLRRKLAAREAGASEGPEKPAGVH